jgi:hypothetical protein
VHPKCGEPVVRTNPYSILGVGPISNKQLSGGVCIAMKKLFLTFLALGAVILPSLTAKADEDRGDHNWNDEYWHNNHEGYWHGHKGHWAYHHHKHTFIEAGPVTIETH